jgi:hypothetical protein
MTYWTCNKCGSFWLAKIAPENSICPACKQSSTFESSNVIEGLKERRVKIMKLIDGFFRDPDADITVAAFNAKKLLNIFHWDVSFIPTIPPEGATYEEKQAMRVHYHITITYNNDQCLDLGGEIKQINIDFLPEGIAKLSDLTQSDVQELSKLISPSKTVLTSTRTSVTRTSDVSLTKEAEEEPDSRLRR